MGEPNRKRLGRNEWVNGGCAMRSRDDTLIAQSGQCAVQMPSNLHRDVVMIWKWGDKLTRICRSLLQKLFLLGLHHIWIETRSWVKKLSSRACLIAAIWKLISLRQQTTCIMLASYSSFIRFCNSLFVLWSFVFVFFCRRSRRNKVLKEFLATWESSSAEATNVFSALSATDSGVTRCNRSDYIWFITKYMQNNLTNRLNKFLKTDKTQRRRVSLIHSIVAPKLFRKFLKYILFTAHANDAVLTSTISQDNEAKTFIFAHRFDLVPCSVSLRSHLWEPH